MKGLDTVESLSAGAAWLKVWYPRKNIGIISIAQKCAEFYPKLHILNFRAIERCCCDQFKKSVYRTFSHAAPAERNIYLVKLWLVMKSCL